MLFLGNLFGSGESNKAYDQIYGYDQQQSHHKASWTHEFIGGAEGFATDEIDQLFETHGWDFLDREMAKRRAIGPNDN